jgi:valyl-tRNA synthetase
VDEKWLDEAAISLGDILVAIATAVRRYKSKNNLSLGAELAELQLSTADSKLASGLRAAEMDLKSITRADIVAVTAHISPQLENIGTVGEVNIALSL